MPDVDGRFALEAPSGRDMQLELDQIEPGDRLGHGMLDLEAGVDLHEREAVLVRLVEELDGPGAAIAGAQGEAPGRGHQRLFLLCAQGRAGRLLDDLLVAPLVRAVAHPDRPGRAESVGDDLHLDVMGGRDQLLEQQRAVAERLECLGARAREGRPERVGLVHAADPPTASSGRGLDHQREADSLGVLGGVLRRGHRSTAPRRHGYLGFLGQALGRDLVPQQAHGLRFGADEHDPEALAQFGELRLLGHEAPSDPHGLRPRGGQSPLERGMIQIAAAEPPLAVVDQARAEADRLVGVADEHRVAL